jgi:hypothetical protein
MAEQANVVFDYSTAVPCRSAPNFLHHIGEILVALSDICLHNHPISISGNLVMTEQHCQSWLSLPPQERDIPLKKIVFLHFPFCPFSFYHPSIPYQWPYNMTFRYPIGKLDQSNVINRPERKGACSISGLEFLLTTSRRSRITELRHTPCI